ncbi:MAG TPA: DUF378 domain-containing protein [Devosia sp.]|jgi:hypothetical protein|nr:DUF378 domain-containing protein [Devosia sp.]
MKIINIITLLLIIIGGINWGLVGAFDLNLVTAIFGEDSFLSNAVFILVGLSALWQIVPFSRSLSAGEVPAERGYRT